MGNVTYFQFFADHVEFLEPLDDAERGRLFSALIAYAFGGEEPVLTGNERYVWPVFRRMLDQSLSKLAQRSFAGKKNAGQTANEDERGSNEPERTMNEVERTLNETERTMNELERTSNETERTLNETERGVNEPQTNLNEPATKPDKNQESRNKNQDSRNKNQDSDGGEGAKRARFTPPTPADVSAYAQEHSLKIEAERFCDFYASKGWRVGTAPMKDWRAAARNWAARDASGHSPPPSRGPRVLSEQMYSQREYVDNTDAALDTMMAEWMKKEGNSA